MNLYGAIIIIEFVRCYNYDVQMSHLKGPHITLCTVRQLRRSDMRARITTSSVH